MLSFMKAAKANLPYTGGRNIVMVAQKLRKIWLEEESIAHIKGWDFSHINDRYTEEDALPWDYRSIIGEYLKSDHRILDMDTGGGEFLLSLGHDPKLIAATEGYAPNVELCKKELLPLGIDFRVANTPGAVPFEDESIDIALNRHGDFIPEELKRVLKPGGLFITQQVGCHNDRELVELLLPGTPESFPNNDLSKVKHRFQQAGFKILKADESYGPIVFYDIGALVWFARIIEWEFVGFSVEKCFDNLLKAQELLEKEGSVRGQIHRFMLVAQK